MESNKQEKYNLMHDNPVAKHASWMSKHSKSAFQMGHKKIKRLPMDKSTPAEMGHSPAEMGHESPAQHKMQDATKGTHWHATDGTVVTEKKGKKHKQKLPTGPNVPAQMKYKK
jgi:hypothetical protein